LTAKFSNCPRLQITVFAGFLAWIWIVGLPSNAENHWKFLSKEEAQWMIDRVERDRADSKLEPFNLKVYLANIKDSKVWAFGCYPSKSPIQQSRDRIGTDGTNSTSQLCNNSRLRNRLLHAHHPARRPRLLSRHRAMPNLPPPPHVFAALLTWATAWVGDRYHLRSPIIVFNNLLMIIGLLLVAFVHAPWCALFRDFPGHGRRHGERARDLCVSD
jgi:hypothetical protein